MHAIRTLSILSLAAFLLGCQPVDDNSAPIERAAPAKSLPASAAYYDYLGITSDNAKDFKFDDTAKTNVTPRDDLGDVEFIDTDARKVRLADYHGKSNVVLVFTRGFSGMICPFCQTQTSRLIANYDKFKDLGAEVLLAYPGHRDRLSDFLAAARKELNDEAVTVPFPILLDEDLNAARFLDIVGELALPSTYILDRQGNVRFAYVGASPADRPSIDAMLGQLRAIEGVEEIDD